MALRADDLIDRRRLRRKLTFWRVAAIIVAAAGLIALSAWVYGDDFAGANVDHIAKVKIEGTITEDEELIKRLETIRESSTVKGVILSIDSPGGTTVGGESIYEEVRKLAADKPVVAEVGTLAASAGYMIATATDHIVARKTSIVCCRYSRIPEFVRVTPACRSSGTTVSMAGPSATAAMRILHSRRCRRGCVTGRTARGTRCSSTAPTARC